MSNDSKAFQQLLDWIKALRSENSGCAWSKQQTFQSLTQYTVEETYELVEAIEQGNPHDIQEELADYLLQFLFYIQIAKEENMFTLTDVAQSLFVKDQQRRVLPLNNTADLTPEQINAIWQAKKLEQRQNQQSVLDDISDSLPSLYKSMKLQQRAADVGFDWPDIHGAVTKFDEEVNELKHEVATDGNQEKVLDELGDVLFTAVNLARHLKIHPDTALRHANNKFKQRFQYIEKQLELSHQQFSDVSLDKLEQLWQQAKQTTDKS